MKYPMVLGTGFCLPDNQVTNAVLMAMLRPTKPDGNLIRPEWLTEKFGIVNRRLDLDTSTVTKLSRHEGGLYDSDLAILAARMALTEAGLCGRDVGAIVHVSCTPDKDSCQMHLVPFWHGLDLGLNCKPYHHNLGCAGLSVGMDTALDLLSSRRNGDNFNVLLVASNCPSAHMSREALAHYADYSQTCVRRGIEDFTQGWGWASPAWFGDGAGAMVLQINGAEDRGLIHAWHQVHPHYRLIDVPVGGAEAHMRADNVWQRLYLMNAPQVSRVYAQLMLENFGQLRMDWDQHVRPAVGRDFDPGLVKRWYFHQANAHAVMETARQLGIPQERVPLNIDRYGNLSAASTLVLLAEDRHEGRVHEGDLVVFMWIGAGVGAMNGYAVMIL